LRPAQKLAVRAWHEESERYESLSFDGQQAWSRALAHHISGTAIYSPIDCSTALRLGLKPIQVHEALVAAGLRPASPTPKELFYERVH
jgi:hypothetical protein